MKRTIMVMFALILAFALVACGGTETTTTAGETATTVEPEAAAPDTTEATEPEPSGDMGTRENPIPLGTAVQVGDWNVTVSGATLDATAAVLAANEFNDEPAAGEQYLLVDVSATYTGDESGTFWVDLMYQLLGSGGNTFDPAYAVTPGKPIQEAGETFSGASVEGQLLYSVSTDQVDGALLMVEESFSFDETRVFFALQ